MKVWLYYRLSRDEDGELNSLSNQRQIIYDYAVSHDYEIVGESCDDNVSGMHFDREGIRQLSSAVDKGKMEAVIVKDLSRLGRHRVQTALYIDYLRSHHVRVLSVTENIDSFNDDDDLIIGFKHMVNDFYAKDGGRRVRTGMRQKQKDGLVMIPPFGYFKDKNTGGVIIIEETADIVHQIFQLYVEGHGFKAIARILNENGIKSPGYYQEQLLGKRQGYRKNDLTRQYLWVYSAVKRVLTNEFYVGTLVCHKSERSNINKTYRQTAPEEQYRHEDAVPAIISRELWEQAQFLLGHRAKTKTKGGAQKIHRYTGLLRCGDCGGSFTARICRQKDYAGRTEYMCLSYHRYGKDHCTSHRIREEELDKLINAELLEIRDRATKQWQTIDASIGRWLAQKNDHQRLTDELKAKVVKLENEIEKILMARIENKENRAAYDNMIAKRRGEIAVLQARIEEYADLDALLRQKKTTLKSSIELLDEIVAAGAISDTHLRMLVKQITVWEKPDAVGKDTYLNLEIVLNADFRIHFDEFEGGELVERGYAMGKTEDEWLEMEAAI